MRPSREIWFPRSFPWRSVPVHWKGFATLFGALAVALPAGLLAVSIGDPTRR
jgi:hypothetical protein